MHLRFFVLWAIGLSSFALADIDLDKLEAALKGDGLEGWVHGSVPRAEQYVFTYRTPGNFFDKIELPVTADIKAAKEALRALNRHDKVRLKGRFLKNEAPIRHILVKEVIVVEKYKPVQTDKPYQYEATLPQDLANKTEFIGKVHAIADEGKVLVVEYKDAIIPVFLKDTTVSKTLYRNDKIKLAFKLREHPGQPAHVMPDPAVKEPLTVLEKQIALQGKPAMIDDKPIEGQLVLYPPSPAISLEVFALNVVDKDGISRDYTLLNNDPDKFKAVREKVKKIWDEQPTSSVVNGRNKLINTKIRLRAKGVFQVVDPGQANPQVLVEGPGDLELAN